MEVSSNERDKRMVLPDESSWRLIPIHPRPSWWQVEIDTKLAWSAWFLAFSSGVLWGVVW